MKLLNSKLIKINTINSKCPNHKNVRYRGERLKGLEAGKKALNQEKEEVMMAEEAGKTKEPDHPETYKSK